MSDYWRERQRLLRGTPAQRAPAQEQRGPLADSPPSSAASAPPPTLRGSSDAPSTMRELPGSIPGSQARPALSASAWGGEQWLDLWARAAAEGVERFVETARDLASPHGWSVHRYRKLALFVKAGQATVLPLPGTLPGESAQLRLWFEWPDRPRALDAWILKQEATAEIPSDLNVGSDRGIEQLANLPSAFIQRGEIRNA